MRTRRALGAGWELGRPGGLGVEVWAAGGRETRTQGLGQRARRGEGPAWAAGNREPGIPDWRSGARPLPSKEPPHTDRCSSPVSSRQGRDGAALFRHGLLNCRGPSYPRPQTRNARTDPGTTHFRLPLPLPPPPPPRAPRPISRRVTVRRAAGLLRGASRDW